MSPLRMPRVTGTMRAALADFDLGVLAPDGEGLRDAAREVTEAVPSASSSIMVPSRKPRELKRCRGDRSRGRSVTAARPGLTERASCGSLSQRALSPTTRERGLAAVGRVAGRSRSSARRRRISSRPSSLMRARSISSWLRTAPSSLRKSWIAWTSVGAEPVTATGTGGSRGAPPCMELSGTATPESRALPASPPFETDVCGRGTGIGVGARIGVHAATTGTSADPP